MLSYIVWDPDPTIFSLGKFDIRWYGLLFALGFIISQQIMYRIFRADGRPEKDVDKLTFYMVVATIIGARLGHVLFYNPEYYFSDPIRILYLREGGLASHGGAAGILVALWLYSRKVQNQSYLWIVDRIVIVVALTGAFIRIGNFMNSEILGKPSESNFGVVFAAPLEEFLKHQITGSEEIEVSTTGKIPATTPGRAPLGVSVQYDKEPVDKDVEARFYENRLPNMLGASTYLQDYVWHNPADGLKYELYNTNGTTHSEFYTYGIVRHPAQLYEAIFCVILFVFLYFLWQKKRTTMPEGYLFGIFFILLWSFRFFIEFLKEWQEEFDNPLLLNMGQLLSIPLALLGVFVVWKVTRKKVPA